MQHDFLAVLKKLLEKQHLQKEEAEFALQEIMQGRVNSTQTAAFLTALKMKGETAEEIAAFAKIMRENAVTIAPKVNNLIDTAGTGGDGSSTFNISTCAAFVAAGAGASVAKHGNRAASSKSGSADVLEQLGVDINIDSKTAQKQLETIGITFLFAPFYHPAMKFVAPVRKELGFKTVFNILGPLTNPANAKRQLIGVYDKSLLKKMAEVLELLGTEKALVVSSNIDEISISSDTEIYEVCGGSITNYKIAPEDFGFKRAALEAIRVEDKIKSAEKMLNALKGKDGVARDVVLLNAGAAIYASGIAGSIGEGISLAERSIDSGKTMEKLELLRDFGKPASG